MNSQIHEAAALWLVEFRTDTPDGAARRRFAAWLRTSPEHIKAYLNLLALWEDAQGCDPQRRLDIDTLIGLARADHTVTELRTDEGPDGRADTLAPAKRYRPHTAVAALLSLVINCGVMWIATDSRNVGYTTRIAEQRSVVLSDGSRIDLDALSDLRVNFTGHERTVELRSGQALFRVTKDAKRPFVVRVDDARFRAVGTKFDVDRTTLGTVLTVLEGHVAVLAASGTGAKLDPGQQATIIHGTITAPQTVDTAAVTGWTRRLLTFNSTPLAVVAEEFNRFSFRRVVVASPALLDFRVTGTFRAFDPESLTDFVLFLRRQPGIAVLENDNQITVLNRSTH
ncbi:MAG TPA: FecR domain-containing protein [Steroidobacteraceae bacterium]|nr:FecR domain-containing protein [Steroidobacteraceae bacterium]